MRLVTKEQARELDWIAIQEMGIPGTTLMGNAGKAVAEQVLQMVSAINDPKVAIFCGKGNNGGDGYKTALDLKNNGLHPQLFVIPAKDEIKGDALHFYQKCVDNDISITHADVFPDERFDLIIDALLGTGFKGELHSPLKEIASAINQAKTMVLAVDIPSGVDANNGKIAENAIISDVTVTMGMTKVGMMFEPAKSYCGEIISVDIGFPNIYKDLIGLRWRMVNEDLAKTYLRTPAKDTYKHRQGKVLVIAGSRGMTGAATLASMGAMRCGTGLVIVCSPASLNTIYETNIIEGITSVCEDSGNGYFIEESFNDIAKHFNWADVILLGPGLGRNESTIKLIKRIVLEADKPLLIDADALQCFNETPELFNKIRNDFVITPHFGELSALVGIEQENLRNDFPTVFEKFLKDFPGTLVAKNAPTCTMFSNEAIVNSTGNQGLATGGSGDVLSGVIASFIAQGMHVEIAAELGVYIHGKAADIVAKEKGFRGLIASDLLTALPKVTMEYE